MAEVCVAPSSCFWMRLAAPGFMVRLAGVEPATLGLEVRCSIQLSYRRARHLRYTSDYGSHSLTRAPTSFGRVRPMFCSAERLTLNVSSVGLATGRSAGLAPRRILSTYSAER